MNDKLIKAIEYISKVFPNDTIAEISIRYNDEFVFDFKLCNGFRDFIDITH